MSIYDPLSTGPDWNRSEIVCLLDRLSSFIFLRSGVIYDHLSVGALICLHLYTGGQSVIIFLLESLFYETIVEHKVLRSGSDIILEPLFELADLD